MTERRIVTGAQRRDARRKQDGTRLTAASTTQCISPPPHHKNRRGVTAFALLLTAVLATLKSPLYAAETMPPKNITVLVHPELAVLPLSRSDLQSIFTLRKRRWDEKTPVRVFVLPDNHPLHRAFCKLKLGVYPYVLREHWDRLTFSGTGHPPTVMNNAEELRQAVLSTPGAIGYTVSDTPPPPAKPRRYFSALDCRRR